MFHNFVLFLYCTGNFFFFRIHNSSHDLEIQLPHHHSNSPTEAEDHSYDELESGSYDDSSKTEDSYCRDADDAEEAADQDAELRIQDHHQPHYIGDH